MGSIVNSVEIWMIYQWKCNEMPIEIIENPVENSMHYAFLSKENWH